MGSEGGLFIFLMLFLLAGLTFAVCSDPYIRRRHRNTLLVIITLCVSLIVQNYVEYLLATGPLRWLERTLAAIYGYTVRPVVIVLFFSIVAPKKRFVPAWILVGLNGCVYCTALFSRVCFWIGENNHFHSGPLRNTCLIVSALLLAYLMYLSVQALRNADKREIANPVLIVLAILAATWADYNMPGNEGQPVSYLTVAMTISCVLYYIWLHMQFVREHEEDLKARQRIQIMMSQIKPHFLFNALSTIQVLCHLDPDKAANVTNQFSVYLRQNLDSLGQPGLIPFWKELEHTKAYASIEEVRFCNIRVEYLIQDSEFSLPPLTLQPMVENAIRHGVRIREEGVVWVSVRKTEGCHEIEVRDNGAGFDVKKLEEMDDTHIGIRNVRQRVESMCGGTLTIESRIDGGTTVLIRIPIKEAAGTKPGKE